MNFHEERFPSSISFGSSGGPERKTDIVTLNNGFEERNAVWAHSRRRYEAGYGVASLDDLARVVAFFEARMGRLYGFRWKDWSDFKSCDPGGDITSTDQEIGTGDGSNVVFQLRKAYASGSQTYWRPIKKIVTNRLFISVEGQLQFEGTDYSADYTTGMISFAAPVPIGHVVRAGFEFDVPVRFLSDTIETSMSSFSSGQIPDIPVLEVRVP